MTPYPIINFQLHQECFPDALSNELVLLSGYEIDGKVQTGKELFMFTAGFNYMPEHAQTHSMSCDFVVIDKCYFSRIAFEDTLRAIQPGAAIYFFECFYDYRVWRRNIDENIASMRVIVNLSSSTFNDALMTISSPSKNSPPPIEMNKKSEEPEEHVLLFSGNNLFSACELAQICGTLNNKAKMSVVNNISVLSLKDVENILRQFISGKTRYSPQYKHIASRAQWKKPMSECDIRTIKLILSGESITYWASVFEVSPKTLYAQRTKLLTQLGLGNRYEGYMYFSQHPDFERL